MVECKEIDLIPIDLKNQIKMIKGVSICTEVCAITLLAVMWVVGFFHDFETGIIFSSAFLLVTTPLLLPGFMFNKVSQSSVSFVSDQIRILDKRGVCWRLIDYNTITDVRVEEISGFFYGHNKDMFRNKYVCIFLNGATNIPNVPYKNLFTEKDFIMFGYHADALQWLLQKYPH